MKRLRLLSLVAVAGSLAVNLGCDADQSFLIPEPVEGAPGVQHLGVLSPVELTETTTAEDVQEQTIYGELGPTGNPLPGGLTFEFEGFNGDACVFIDPESLFWNQSVSQISPNEEYTQPDNVYDDGDLDMSAGFSVYYTGTPDERMGGFRARDEDALGNQVPVELVACEIFEGVTGNGNPGAHAGRGSPEYCTIRNTLQGVKYTVVFEAFSLPFDDHRLGYGLLFTTGPCAGAVGTEGPTNLFGLMGASADSPTEECVITGESIKPASPVAAQGAVAIEMGLPAPTWVGGEKKSWERSESFEDSFCLGGLADFCRNERKRNNQAGVTCSWDHIPLEGEVHCFCGDIVNTPAGGAF